MTRVATSPLSVLRRWALAALAVAVLAAQALAAAHDPGKADLADHVGESCAACAASGGAPDPAGAPDLVAAPAPAMAPAEFQSVGARASAALVLSPQSRGPPSAFITQA